MARTCVDLESNISLHPHLPKGSRTLASLIGFGLSLEALVDNMARLIATSALPSAFILSVPLFLTALHARKFTHFKV